METGKSLSSIARWVTGQILELPGNLVKFCSKILKNDDGYDGTHRSSQHLGSGGQSALHSKTLFQKNVVYNVLDAFNPNIQVYFYDLGQTGRHIKFQVRMTQ